MIKKYIRILLCGIIASSMLVGCGGKKETISAKANNEDLSAEKKEQLTISTYFPDGYLEEAAKLFEQKHPEVSIKINTYKNLSESVEVAPGQVAAGEDSNANHTLENYITYLNTAFMSGEADDMILMSWLPANKYVESGYLMDLKNMIETDSDLTDENYYMDIIKDSSYKDNIFCIPLVYSFDMISMYKTALNKSELDRNILQEDYWSFDKMEDSLKKVVDRKKKKVYLQCSNGINLFDTLFRLERCQFIDMETKKVNINSKEFIDLLEKCKELEKNNDLYIGEQEEKYALFTGCSGGTQGVLYQEEYIPKDEERVCTKPMVNENKEISRINSKNIAITKDAKNKELCWTFMKFLLSEEMQTNPELTGGYAINKKASSTRIEKMVSDWVNEINKGHGKLNVTQEELVEQIKNKVDTWVNMPSIKGLITRDVSKTISEEVAPFFEGKKSAEEVAKTLQDKLYVMLNE